MHILMVTAEFAPLAKTGGLADAVAGLSRALVSAGHQVRVLLPRYAHLHDQPTARQPFTIGTSRFFALAGTSTEPEVWLTDTVPAHGEPGPFDDNVIYTGDDRDAARFLALSTAAAAVATSDEWRPDVMHCHDWHAAMAAAMLSSDEVSEPQRLPVLLSLHNVGYQGVFGLNVLADERFAALRELVRRDGDGERYRTADDDPAVNFLRTGIRHATRLSTVSSTYAREIQGADYGMGLEDLLSARAADLSGILNGVDYSHWDPATDPHLPAPYDAAHPSPKRLSTEALCQRLTLSGDGASTVIGVVSRITWQKGIDVLAEALPTLLERTDARFAILGTGDTEVVAQLHDIAAADPARVGFVEGYDEALAHLIFAGSHLLLVPSRYEPCGLTQLYALRYGTTPVVRKTGGLADTILPFDPSSGHGNGAVFETCTPAALTDAVCAAVGWYRNPALREQLVRNGMLADYSWARQVAEYEALYGKLI
jgi:starch synthase